MDKRLSIKISIISFFLLLFVVVNHAVNIQYSEAGQNTVWFIETLISYQLSKVMIPSFFFISSYLFFISMDKSWKFDLAIFREKIAKRIKTLAVPYIFWCTFWFLFLYVLQIVPAMKPYFSTPLYGMSTWQQIWNLYIEPLNYPFWFIRELLLYVFISPVLFLVVKYLKGFSLLILFSLAAFSFSVFTIWDVDIYRYHMLFYYCLGIYCAVNRLSLKISTPLAISILLLLVFVGLCIGMIYIDLRLDAKQWYFKLLSNITTLIGCVSMWSLYDHLDSRYSFKYHKVFAYGFIIYATHGIPILLLKEGFVSVFQPDGLISLLFYFASIALTILGCIFFGMLFKKMAPNLYSVVTGSR